MLSPIEEIKARIDIVELVQSYVKLQKAGVNYKANCPFHGERTPSFFVTPSRQIWHCFGCGKGGDIFKFITEIEGMDFPEALKLLAGRANVVLKREDPAIRSERNRLYDICALATEIFERAFSLTPVVKSYMHERGITDETIRLFRIGYAPESWDFLLKNLTQRKFSAQDIEKAGLAIKSSDGSGRNYDRFRSRIMFPITDANGRVIGFGGRIFESESLKQKPKEENRVEAKYINTPQTLIYDKSRVLYGFDKAKQEIRTQNSAVIVEGYMDCVMSHQAGVTNTVAVSGTALTGRQLTLLKRLCNSVICSFDTDSAGESATKRSLALAAQFEFERLVIRIPSGKDPADTVCENPDAWREAVKNAKPVVEFYFEKVFREQDAATAAGKKAIGAVLIPLVAEIGNEVEKAHWIGELSRRLDVPETAVVKELDRKKYGGQNENFSSVVIPAPKARTRREMLEERYLSLLSTLTEEERLRESGNQDIVFAIAAHQELFRQLTAPASSTDENVGMFTPSAVEVLRFKSEIMDQQSTTSPKEEFLLCRLELRKSWLKERLQQLTAEIQRTEKIGDRAVVTSLLQDFRTVSETLESLSA
ncbi:MAG: DNA primase [Candidatus Sungbacteria bacterium]|nr:DNA primase [Candidatus Sungbacteria bacterium]